MKKNNKNIIKESIKFAPSDIYSFEENLFITSRDANIVLEMLNKMKSLDIGIEVTHYIIKDRPNDKGYLIDADVIYYGPKLSAEKIIEKYFDGDFKNVNYTKSNLTDEQRKDYTNIDELTPIIRKAFFDVNESINIKHSQLYFLNTRIRFSEYNQTYNKNLIKKCRDLEVNSIMSVNRNSTLSKNEPLVTFIGTRDALEYINDNYIDPMFRVRTGIHHYKFDRTRIPDFETKYDLEDYYKEFYNEDINESIKFIKSKWIKFPKEIYKEFEDISNLLLPIDYFKMGVNDYMLLAKTKDEANEYLIYYINKEVQLIDRHIYNEKDAILKFSKYKEEKGINESIKINKSKWSEMGLEHVYNTLQNQGINTQNVEPIKFKKGYLLLKYYAKIPFYTIYKLLKDNSNSLKKFELLQYFDKENNQDAIDSFDKFVNHDVNESIKLVKNTPSEEMPEPGDRVIAIEMIDDPDPIKIGEKGTVLYIDSAKNIHVEWDNGRHLALIYGIDKYRILNESIKFEASVYKKYPELIKNYTNKLKSTDTKDYIIHKIEKINNEYLFLVYYENYKNNGLYCIDKVSENGNNIEYVFCTSSSLKTAENKFIEILKNGDFDINESIKFENSVYKKYPELIRKYISHFTSINEDNHKILKINKINDDKYVILIHFLENNLYYIDLVNKDGNYENKYTIDSLKIAEDRFKTIVDRFKTIVEMNGGINESIKFVKPFIPDIPNFSYNSFLKFIDYYYAYKNKCYIKILDFFAGKDFYEEYSSVNKNNYYILISIKNDWEVLEFVPAYDSFHVYDDYHINNINLWPTIFKKGFKQIIKDYAECSNCEHIFNYTKTPEKGMGYVQCPKCGAIVTQKNLISNNINESIKINKSKWSEMGIIDIYDYIKKYKGNANFNKVIPVKFKNNYLLIKSNKKNEDKQFYALYKINYNDDNNPIEYIDGYYFSIDNYAIKTFNRYFKDKEVNESIKLQPSKYYYIDINTEFVDLELDKEFAKFLKDNNIYTIQLQEITPNNTSISIDDYSYNSNIDIRYIGLIHDLEKMAFDNYIPSMEFLYDDIKPVDNKKDYLDKYEIEDIINYLEYMLETN